MSTVGSGGADVTPSATGGGGTSAVPKKFFFSGDDGGAPTALNPGDVVTYLTKTVTIDATGPDVLITAMLSANGETRLDANGIAAGVFCVINVDGSDEVGFDVTSVPFTQLGTSHYKGGSGGLQWAVVGLPPGNHVFQLNVTALGTNTNKIDLIGGSLSVVPFATSDATFP